MPIQIRLSASRAALPKRFLWHTLGLSRKPVVLRSYGSCCCRITRCLSYHVPSVLRSFAFRGADPRGSVGPLVQCCFGFPRFPLIRVSCLPSSSRTISIRLRCSLSAFLSSSAYLLGLRRCVRFPGLFPSFAFVPYLPAGCQTCPIVSVPTVVHVWCLSLRAILIRCDC